MPVGTVVFSKGYKTGCQTREVIDISLDTGYGIKDCVVITNICDYGDSGGLVGVTHDNGRHYVAGIITGKSNRETVAYVKIGNLLNSLNVTIYY